MDKKTTIAFIFIGAILVLWLYLNSPKPTEQAPGIVDTTLVSKDTVKNNQTVKENHVNIPSQETARSEKKTDSSYYGKYFSTPTGAEKIITIENDLVRLELTSRGGDIKKYFLKNYKNWYSSNSNNKESFYDTHVQLVNYPEGGGGPDLSFITSDGKAINTADLNFSSNANKAYYKVAGNDSLIITFTLSAGVNKYLEKKYIFYGDKYSMNCTLKFVGLGDVIGNNDVDFVWKKGLRFVEENSVDEAIYSNASAYYGGDNVLVEATKNGEKVQKDFKGMVNWVAARDKYFATILAPQNPSDVDGAFIEGTKETYMNSGERSFYNIRLELPFNNTSFEQKNFTIYIGPVDYNLLKTYGHNFDQLVDFGSFLGLRFIIKPIAEYVLLPLFNFLHTFIPNYGLVIIVFSLIIKIVLYPLTKSSFQSMKKMQLLQPKITELKEKYKDDPQRMNKETMKLYSTYGVNPAGGCLPLILQMPVFVALWGVLKTAIELRQQPFLFWITDLSKPDVIYTMPFKIPFFGIDQISGLALLMGVTQFIQQKMTVKDPKQQSLIYIMPIFLTLLFMSFPAGLNLYYFLFNLFSIVQQYYINHKHDGMELQPVKNAGSQKKGFMSKLMEAAEQNAKGQQQRRRK